MAAEFDVREALVHMVKMLIGLRLDQMALKAQLIDAKVVNQEAFERTRADLEQVIAPVIGQLNQLDPEYLLNILKNYNGPSH